MTGPTHVVIALAATVIVTQTTEFSAPNVWGWAALIGGALMPDIDEPTSTASNPAAIFGKLIPRWVQNLLNIPFQAASVSIRSVFGHRGATHYLIWPFIVGWFAWHSENSLLLWFAWGYLLHEFADWITRIGIPAIGPFYRKNFSILPKPLSIKTGGSVEDLISTFCWLYLIYAAYVYL